jgi:hypothetical protein
MTRRRLPSPGAWVAVLGTLAAVSTVATVPLSILTGQGIGGLTALVIGTPAAAVGAVVAWRQPRNPLGWLLLVIGDCLILANDGSDYALLAFRPGHHLPLGLLALALGQLWAVGIELFGLVVLLFPDGRLASRWWRRALAAYCVIYVCEIGALGAAMAQAMTADTVRVDVAGGLAAADNPVGWYAAVQHAGLLAFLGLLVSFVVRQALSWRRASGERRQQLKWLASGAAFTVACAVGAPPAGASSSPVLRVAGGLAWFGFAALPVSVGVGILKYRLYEIDRIISRTLAYALVTGLLAGMYVGLVLLATRLLAVAQPVSVAAATLAAAALFNPLRRRIQGVVDRRFNRARYDAERTVAAFTARLQDAVDLDTVREDLTSAVQKALEPAHVHVWVSGPT